jgi:hypothetical protein
MSITRCSRTQVVFCALTIALIQLVALTAGANAGSTITVPPPNGSDDTNNIQSALNACVGLGPGCTVQLQTGTYHTRQLVTYNFQGTFKGMGQNSTTIEAIYPLTVTYEPVGGTADSVCQPTTTTKCLWADLIIFVNGDIHVSDLSLNEPAPPGTATTPWNLAGLGPYVGLFDLLTFTGQHANAYVDRVHAEGLADPTNTLVGFNVVSGVHFTGEFPRSSTPIDWYFLSGSYTVRNSSFKNMNDGVSQDAYVKSSVIEIGGSPTTGNTFENLNSGMDLETMEDSRADVSYNESTGIYDAMDVVPWFYPWATTSPSQYSIHDNQLFTSQSGAGIFIQDNTAPLPPFIDAAIWNNSIQLQNSLSEGIPVYNTKGTQIWNNSITGSDEIDAIALYSSTLGAVIDNSVGGVTLDSAQGTAQTFLDPGTSKDLVVCSNHSNTVLNQGTDNVVANCR